MSLSISRKEEIPLQKIGVDNDCKVAWKRLAVWFLQTFCLFLPPPLTFTWAGCRAADRLAAALAAAVAGRGDVTSDIVGGGTKREGGEGAGVGKTHELHPCMTTNIRLVPKPRRSAASYVVPSL